jgi:hypothetical protein
MVTGGLVTVVRPGNSAKVTHSAGRFARFVSWRFGGTALVSFLQEVAFNQGER